MMRTYGKKSWDYDYMKRGININATAQEIDSRARAIEGNESRKKDTEIRVELQSEIKELARAGKSVSEIVKILSTSQEYEKFSKFEKYFVGYAENHVSKFGKPNKQNRKDDEQR